MSEEVRELLMKNIRRRLTPQPVKVRADIEVTCFQYEGIDAIKRALKKGEQTSTEETPISVRPFVVLLIVHRSSWLLPHCMSL